MEPPSNQSYHGYNYLPLWPDEVKRVGIKRPYPFPPEFPPVPTFHCKFPPRYDAPMSTANSDSRTYLKRFDISPEVSVVLVVEYSPLTSLVDQLVREVPLKSRNVVGQNRALNGDFLTLAPPTAVGAVNQQVFPNIAPQNIELFKFETLPFQEVSEEPSTRSSLNRSVQQRVFRFFPPPNVQIGQPGNTHGEVGGKVDLNLKL
uniref:Uncharacterized protein n=2 Tax=Solanum tuberosum TaxID=4113 RepID=M1AX47_SOLTU